jgi:anti-anti-sigma regulatory factor
VLQVSALPDRCGARAVGEVGLSTARVWERLLEQLADRDEKVCVLELSAVTFVDVAGATALAMTAQRLPDDRRIILQQPPHALQRMLEMFWPDLPMIEVAA